MAKRRATNKKQKDHLLALGATFFSDQRLVRLTEELREKHKITPELRELDPSYEQELQRRGITEEIRKEALVYFENELLLEDEEPTILEHLLALLIRTKDKKAKDVLDAFWPLLEMLKESVESDLGEHTVGGLFDKHGLPFIGDFIADQYVEYVITDEIKPFPLEQTGIVAVPVESVVFAIAGPLTDQKQIVEQFKEALSKAFPKSKRPLSDVTGATALLKNQLGQSDSQIAAEAYDLDPDREDFDQELKKKSQNIRKRKERVKRKVKDTM